jgi:NAD(P)-dependent dehydrogenase (short-subunit alcohol dehydrogenase family)
VVVDGDATTRVDNDRAVAAVESAFGGLDVLVCCVGVFDFRRRLDDIAPERLDAAFDEMFTVNVKSILHSVQASLPALRRSEGSVILTESTSAYFPGRGGVLYTASKFAVRGLVLALAHELAPEIRVNGVAPGATMHTDLAGLDTLGLADHRLHAPDREHAIIEQSPLRVALSGADHAWSYVFLASSRSRGVTGDVVHTDGGMKARAQ